MNYVPASPADREQMLTDIGVDSFEQLIAAVPEQIRNPHYDVPEGMSEYDAAYTLKLLAHKNKRIDHYDCFLGGGAYDHFIPSVVPALAGRSEFVTAYTPYQPEASQGTLQAIFEYQSMIAEITGLDVANASLYEAGSACAEAALLMLNSARNRSELLVAGTLHPWYRDVIKTYIKYTGFTIKVMPHTDGRINPDDISAAVSGNTAGLIIQSPNFFGCIEDVEKVTAIMHEHGALVSMACNPLSLSILKSPGEMGVDIAVGEGQPFGVNLQYGGPYFGFFACTNALMRRIPGRVVGMTTDTQGRRSFVLTLQAREQHIRREKATSNICTNQALMSLCGCIYMSWIGKDGFVELGKQNIDRAQYAAAQAAQLDGVSLAWQQPFFNEFCLKFDTVDAAQVAEKILDDSIFAGIPVRTIDTSLPDLLLVSVTEKRSKEDIDSWIASLKKVLDK